LPNGDQFYGFPSEKDALKIGKHNGGQAISSPEERKPFGAFPQDGSEAFSFLRTILPGVGGLLYGAACTYDNTPDEDFIIDTLPGMTTPCSSPG
jgi:N-methyl-L-tryptophan oxidase